MAMDWVRADILLLILGLHDRLSKYDCTRCLRCTVGKVAYTEKVISSG